MDKAKLAETVRAAQNGDEKALEALYLEYAKRIYYLALKIMRNKEDAEDITQEVFITVCQKISELKEPEAFGLWLNRITANKCTNAFKKKSRFTEQDISEFDETEFADFLTENDPLLIPEKSLDDAETKRMIVEIIDALPDAQRLCVYYYYYEQMTIAQIAEVLEAKENTVKKRLYLARDKIRKELERLDKEEGTKLYTFVPLMLTPILKSSLQNFEMPNTQGLWNNITAATANAAPGVAATVSKGAIIMGSKAKIAIGVASLVLVAGVIISVIIGNSGNDGTSENPISTADGQTSPNTTAQSPIGNPASNYDFEYTHIPGGIMLTKYIGNDKDVVIPATIEGEPVIRIGAFTFDGTKIVTNERADFIREITSIIIPDSVEIIDNHAFAGCDSLTEIIIPPSVTSIGTGAFYSTGLISATFTNSDMTIESGAFANSSELKSITFPEGITKIDDSAFSNIGLEAIVIPEGVTHIGYGAFGGNIRLTSVVLPSTLISIDEYAFYGCSLTSLTLPDGLEILGDWAFYQNEELTEVTVPDSVTSIGTSTFGQYGISCELTVIHKGVSYMKNNLRDSDFYALYRVINGIS